MDRLRRFTPDKVVWMESESVKIGKLHVPSVLHKEMGKSQYFKITLPLAERIQHIIQIYPDYIENFQFTKEQLLKLQKHHSGSRVRDWITLGERQQWPEFVEALLTEHYDPLYSRSQRKYFKSHATEVYLDSLGPEHVQPFLQRLISYSLSEVKDVDSMSA